MRRWTKFQTGEEDTSGTDVPTLQLWFLMYSLSPHRDLSYIKIMDVGQRFLVNRVLDHIQSRIVYYLMNIHITPRSIYLCRHGESDLNVNGRIGGDSGLTPNGKAVLKKKKKLQEKVVTELLTFLSKYNKLLSSLCSLLKS